MWENKLLAGLCVLLLSASTVRADVSVAAGPTRIHKLHYEFWFEPDDRGSVQLKLKAYKECEYALGGTDEGEHTYFTNPFVSVESSWAEKLSGGRKTPIYDISKSDYQKAGILYSETQHYTYRFPELRAGDRTVSTTVYAFRESRNLIPLHYGESVPVDELKIRFRIPPGMDVVPGYHRCDSSEFRISRIQTKKETVLELVRSDVPAIDLGKQKDVDASYYSPFVYFFVKGGQVFGSPVYSLAGVSDLYAYNRGYLNMTPASDTAKLRAVADTLVSPTRTPRENMERIFDWVRNNIQYIAIMDGKKAVVPEPASTVLSSKYGDCKGMTSLLVGLADAAHIPLHYGWVGTRDISFQPSEMPIPFAFNHMIGIYIDGGDTLVLDATGKQAYMGEVSSQLYNKEVLITLDENRFALYKIPTPEPEKNKLEVNARYYLSETESEWKANYSAQLEGQKKIAFNYLSKLPTSSFDKKAKPNAVFSETENSVAVAYQIEENNSQKARVSWQQPLENGVVQLTDSWLINPYPNKYKSLLAIDTDERDSPILIDFPFEEKMTFSISIPEGYELANTLPDTAYTGAVGSIRCQTRQNGQTLETEFSLTVQPLLIYPADFTQFNLFKDTLKECVSKFIVLHKKD